MSSVDTQIPSYVRFAIAGLSGGGASFVSHPFDLVKYRMQLSGKGGTQREHKTSLHAVYNIAKREGPLGIYTGLSASILRQLTLTMTRLGLYSAIVDHFTKPDGTPPSLSVQVLAGLSSGFIGAVIGNPTDIVLVRMSSDGRLPLAERYNYKHAFNGIYRMAREEGFPSLWTGWKPAALRCMVRRTPIYYTNKSVLCLARAQVLLLRWEELTRLCVYQSHKPFGIDLLAIPQVRQTSHNTLEILPVESTGYDGIPPPKAGRGKEYFQDNFGLHLLTSAFSALVSSFATAPIDIVKTRLMSMKTVKGKPEYTGMTDVWIKIIRLEGFHSLWKGVTPTFARILPNNLMIFIILEFLTKTYKRVVLGDKSGSGF